jgi:hypothetical protein
MVYNVTQCFCKQQYTRNSTWHTSYIPYIGICYIRVTLLLSMIENCDVQEEGEEEARHKIYNGTLWKVQNEITTLSPHHELKNFKKNVKR